MTCKDRPASMCDTISAEDMNRMTLQVGLVGSDGTVLASDRLINNAEGDDFALSIGSKVFSGNDVVCCWSGSDAGLKAASLIRDNAGEWGTLTDLERDQKLKNCGNDAWKSTYGGVDVPLNQICVRSKVLVVFPSDCSLWQLEVLPYSIAARKDDKTVAGGSRTTVRHLINDYVPAPPDRLPVCRLVTIASHAIVIGHREDPASIDGLEVAVVVKGESPIFLSEEQEGTLMLRSKVIDTSLRGQLLQEFDYRPVRAD